LKAIPGNTKGGRITVPLTSFFDWFGLVCFANKNKFCQLSYSGFQTKQEVNGTVILPPLVFPGYTV